MRRVPTFVLTRTPCSNASLKCVAYDLAGKCSDLSLTIWQVNANPNPWRRGTFYDQQTSWGEDTQRNHQRLINRGERRFTSPPPIPLFWWKNVINDLSSRGVLPYIIFKGTRCPKESGFELFGLKTGINFVNFSLKSGACVSKKHESGIIGR